MNMNLERSWNSMGRLQGQEFHLAGSFSKLSVASPTSELILLCSFSKLSVASPTSELTLQPFPRFTYVTAHSPTIPLLYVRHSSFSNASFASPTSQDFHLCRLASRPWLPIEHSGGLLSDKMSGLVKVIWGEIFGVLQEKRKQFVQGTSEQTKKINFWRGLPGTYSALCSSDWCWCKLL